MRSDHAVKTTLRQARHLFDAERVSIETFFPPETGLAFGFGYSRRAALLKIALSIFAAAIEVVRNIGSWLPREVE
jgi:hypothetical protein